MKTRNFRSPVFGRFPAPGDRSILTFAVATFSGWSQPAPSQVQPPLAVQVEMPPTNFWMRFSELVVPALIGAGVAFFGVWLTNRTNERTNARTREHQQEMERIKDQIAAEAKERDNRWAFRKDVYSGVVKTISSLLLLDRRLGKCVRMPLSVAIAPSPFLTSGRLQGLRPPWVPHQPSRFRPG
jgi:hypothetical protein